MREDGVGPHPTHPTQAGDDVEQVPGDKVPTEAAECNEAKELEATRALRRLFLVKCSGRRPKRESEGVRV